MVNVGYLMTSEMSEISEIALGWVKNGEGRMPSNPKSSLAMHIPRDLREIGELSKKLGQS